MNSEELSPGSRKQQQTLLQNAQTDSGGPPSLLFIEYRGTLRGINLTINPYLVAKMRMSGDAPSLPPHAFSVRRDNFTFIYTATIFGVLQLNRAGNNASDVQTKGGAVRSQPSLLSPAPPSARLTSCLEYNSSNRLLGNVDTYIYQTNDVTQQNLSIHNTIIIIIIISIFRLRAIKRLDRGFDYVTVLSGMLPAFLTKTYCLHINVSIFFPQILVTMCQTSRFCKLEGHN